MVSARIGPLCSSPADVSLLYYRRRRFPAHIHLSLVQEPGGGGTRETRFISQRDNDFILESISYSLGGCGLLTGERDRERIGRRRPSSRFCLDCAPVIYSGTISTRPPVCLKRIRDSRLHSPQLLRLPGDNSHGRRGMRLECAGSVYQV